MKNLLAILSQEARRTRRSRSPLHKQEAQGPAHGAVKTARKPLACQPHVVTEIGRLSWPAASGYNSGEEDAMAISTGSVTITPVHPALGAEIGGVDLTRPLDDAAFARIGEAFDEHSLPVLHEQPLTAEQPKGCK